MKTNIFKKNYLYYTKYYKFGLKSDSSFLWTLFSQCSSLLQPSYIKYLFQCFFAFPFSSCSRYTIFIFITLLTLPCDTKRCGGRFQYVYVMSADPRKAWLWPVSSACSTSAQSQFSWEDGFPDLFIIYSMLDMCVMVALTLHCRLSSVCENYIQNNMGGGPDKSSSAFPDRSSGLFTNRHPRQRKHLTTNTSTHMPTLLIRVCTCTLVHQHNGGKHTGSLFAVSLLCLAFVDFSV